VKDAERASAKKLFGTAEEPSAAASKIMGIKSKTFDVSSSLPSTNGSKSRVKLTATEKKRVEELIRNAKSLQEIDRIQKDLAEGRVPGGVRDVEMS